MAATILAELQAQETELKNAKDQLSSQLQGVEDSLASVRIRIAEVQNINRNAPTYNLPNETLSAIFEAGSRKFSSIKRSRASWELDMISRKPFELLVSSVSHRWRNVALHTPRLWTNLDINLTQSTGDLLDLYLCRSKMCLLDITFGNVDPTNPHDVNPDKDFIANNLERHLAQLLPHITRWRVFIMRDIRFEALSTTLSPLAHLHAPSLETMVIDCDNHEHKDAITVFSAGAPRLSSVELLGARVRPPSRAITSLELGSYPHFTYTEFSKFVLAMSSLAYLSLRSNTVINPMNQPTIELPSVHSLDIHLMAGPFSHSASSVGALHFIDLPAVEILTVEGFTDDVITAFTKSHRPFPLVRSLKITSRYPGVDRDVSTAITLDFISLFPSVQDVAFHTVYPTPILYALHARQPTDELLWPQLIAITIIPGSGVKVSSKKQTWAYITKFVGNRLRLGHPISRVHLSSEVLERASYRQKQRLREQVALIEC